MSAGTSRRDFLRVALSAAGALVMEMSLPGCGGAIKSYGMMKRPDGGAADFVPNAFIKIGTDDRVSFVLDRVEMGQGTMTSHAQLVAEELEIAVEKLHVELAGAHSAFNNPMLNMQITGGSTSVAASFVPLRTAAATAREMLKHAAAAKWGVGVSELKADDGAIVHEKSGRRARYGELATAAASIRLDEAPALKEPKDWKIIGKPIVRKDARTKVDGSAIYGIDVNVPNMRVAVVLRAPTLGAKVQSFDGATALKDPGVEAVLEIPNGVAVVAKSYWRARKAAEKVKVVWSDPNTSLDSELIDKAYRERVSRDAPPIHSWGDFSGAKASAAHTLEAVYELPYLAHATMEPQNATAWVHDDRCDVWAPTQSPALAAESVHRITGFSFEDIAITQTLLGGGFGRRLQQDYIDEAVEIAVRVKYPVKVVWSREDDMRNEGYRPKVTSFMRGTVGADGKITSWLHRLASQSIIAQAGSWIGAFVPHGVPTSAKIEMGAVTAGLVTGLASRPGVGDITTFEGAGDLLYDMPAFRVELASIEPEVPVGSWRSVGVSHTTFVVESFLDELAAAGNKDPFELRRQMMKKGSRGLGVLELAAAKAGWTTPPPQGTARGIAVGTAFNSFCAQVAEVTMGPHGLKVTRIVAAIDCGMVVNPDIVKMQIESSIAFGLGAALKQQITLKKGAVEQSNFHDFEPLRLHEMPAVEVYIVDSKEKPTGVGEPGVPPIAPAVANAVFKLTGKRIRRLPFTVSVPEIMS